MTRRLLAAAVAAVALAGCSKAAEAPPDALPSPSPSSPAPSVTPTPTPSSSPAVTGTMTAAVYYVGNGASAKLYREFRRVPRSTATIRAAVDAMLHLSPLDPDYRSVWPTITHVNGIAVSGSVATIDLSSNARSRTASATVEAQSLQQLVHTVTAAAPSITGVRLRFDGATASTLWGHVPTTGTLTRATHYETLAAVWVESPAQRSTVGRTLTVKGTATVFEATVSWSLTRLDGTRIASGVTNATVGGPGRGAWSVTVTVPATVTGDVVFTAWESSARDGSVVQPDDKRFTLSS